MYTQLAAIFQFVVEQFTTSWPYLLITIPLAVAVKLSGAARFINRALSAQPLVAIVLATVVGAFSPFCSCSVIPVVASLLIGGVPLAPVMSFWIASPSMDPEIFFLSVSTLGWELSLWRLGSTLVLSLAAGFVTFFLTQRGWLGNSILRTGANNGPSLNAQAKETWTSVVSWLSIQLSPQPWPVMAAAAAECSTCTAAASASATVVETETPQQEACGAPAACTVQPSFGRRLLAETWAATLMVVKFMLLAYFLEALIVLYVPQEWIVSTLGGDQPLVVVLAALLGIPVYTSNLAAMPLVGGLLAQGMSPAAALAFLIAGPTTTLPAMAAVAGLVTRRVFALYVGFALFGAIAAGFAYVLAQLLR
jgi:uncharacterized protein